MDKSGSCLCRAVSYTIKNASDTCGICHCDMCRKWSGGVYIGYSADADQVSFTGEDNITTYTSSEWAERGFCKNCGTSLFYRVTAPGPHHGQFHFGFGTLDDPSGVKVSEEIFIDQKPDSYSFAGKTKKMTAAEVFAAFAPPD
ncbi:Glutathione-dependent formaldehyde-activating enzyme [Roseovarius albus]|uniref:Glutathione-dependent formaldehyde-activating enzyme n=1 Tax=Roseovarius albus TaxID=1247867 RepID=A0A1X7A607_9RHOB|nr:GFA family protein [Roseovarius albus]SLN71526.1 Glutathione-dependent formaldehyde-activating enzyme [Roseovarius albus]